MLVVPIVGKLSWRHPPLVTIALILVNAAIFFGFQYDDGRAQQEALTFYVESGLAQLELQAYLRYKNRLSSDPQAEPDLDPGNGEHFHQLVDKMWQDEKFQQELAAGHLIRPQAEGYEKWRTLRTEYEDKLARDVSFRFGFIPQRHHALNMLTHMFLHGSVGHLLGNMVFLWLVGCMLELGCGGGLFLALYLIGGVMAVSFFWLLNLSSQIPLIGASGAISALMGAFAVLFGKKKVKVFLSLGFYFNYLSVPALILLPVWLGKEAFMHFFSDLRQVAYAAHFGGIAGGALLGWGIIRFTDCFKADVLPDEIQDPTHQLLDQALAKVSQLDLQGGRELLEQVLARDAGHLAALSQLFHIDKLQPQAPRFHQTAAKLLSALSERPENFSKAGEIYQQYVQLGAKPSLSPALYLRMSYVLSEVGQFETSERILDLLIRKRPDLPGISSTLLKIARRWAQAGRPEKARRLEQLIAARYPHSPEARLVAQG
jgi:membrane associated rhomboid family serine protease